MLRRTLTAATLVLACALTPAAYASGGTPGATTAGDSLFPGFGNGGYDAQHYAIALRYFFDDHITAASTMTATATQALSAFSMDLSGLTVSSVQVDGRTAAYSRSGHKLTITPASPIPDGTTFTVRVAYAGTPQPYVDPDGSRDGWVSTKNGAAVLAEPVGSMTWFPDNDTPRDKATYDVSVTTRRHMTVAGVGVESGRKAGSTLATTSWHQAEPISSYLAAVAIEPFSTVTGTAAGVPLTSYLDANTPTSWMPSTVAAALNFDSATFGPYPFDAGGVSAVDGVPFSLEVATRPIVQSSIGTGVLVHELSHEWYGDEVTPADWGDIWLNEGFATYAAWLWWGRTTAGYPQQQLNRLYSSEPSSFWSLPPANLGSAKNLFAKPVYFRGAMMLQALRDRIGRTDFNALLRRWLALHRYAAVRTADFTSLAQQISGQDLSTFFHDWLYQPGRPPR